MDVIWLDLETRSQCNLLVHGLARYAQDATTEAICMSYAFNDGPVRTWFAEDADEFPAEVLAHFYAGGVIAAHNATFERYLFDYVISNDYNFKPPALAQYQCTAARALAHGMPKKLRDACLALNMKIQKQPQGMRLIREYCAPGFQTEWRGDDKALMQEYCETDVEAMRGFCDVLRELTPEEWNQYHVTEIINDRGVPIDVPFATAALSYSEEVKADVNARINKLTGGKVSRSTLRKARDAWLLPQLTEDQKQLLTIKKKGVEKISFDAEHRGYLLNDPSLKGKPLAFMNLLEEAGGSSVSKYKTMVNHQVEGRVHDTLIWNGAGQTGRYSSVGLQMQNFSRQVCDEPEAEIKRVINREALPAPADTLKRLLRAAITGDQGLSFSDYSQIEARVLPWLPNNAAGELTLDIFREGRDLYTENAGYMFPGQEVDKEVRQSSKVGSLACGFGGSVGAVKVMGKSYGMIYTDAEALLIRDRWRAANPWAAPFWYDMSKAASNAVRYPMTEFVCGRISFFYNGADWLWMKLPSGRCLAYYQPKFEFIIMPWGDESLELTAVQGGQQPKAGQSWPRRNLSYLILVENAVQATAADIMREAIVRAHEHNLPVVSTVHDEMIVEGHCPDLLHEIMETPPAWAEGLPLNADTQFNWRYGK